MDLVYKRLSLRLMFMLGFVSCITYCDVIMTLSECGFFLLRIFTSALPLPISPRYHSVSVKRIRIYHTTVSDHHFIICLTIYDNILHHHLRAFQTTISYIIQLKAEFEGGNGNFSHTSGR